MISVGFRIFQEFGLFTFRLSCRHPQFARTDEMRYLRQYKQAVCNCRSANKRPYAVHGLDWTWYTTDCLPVKAATAYFARFEAILDSGPMRLFPSQVAWDRRKEHLQLSSHPVTQEVPTGLKRSADINSGVGTTQSRFTLLFAGESLSDTFSWPLEWTSLLRKLNSVGVILLFGCSVRTFVYVTEWETKSMEFNFGLFSFLWGHTAEFWNGPHPRGLLLILFWGCKKKENPTLMTCNGVK